VFCDRSVEVVVDVSVLEDGEVDVDDDVLVVRVVDDELRRTG